MFSVSPLVCSYCSLNGVLMYQCYIFDDFYFTSLIRWNPSLNYLDRPIYDRFHVEDSFALNLITYHLKQF